MVNITISCGCSDLSEILMQWLYLSPSFNDISSYWKLLGSALTPGHCWIWYQPYKVKEIFQIL